MQSSAPSKKCWKWLNRIFGLLVFLVMIVAVTVLVMVVINNLRGKDSEIFGYRLIYVLTDSMEPMLVQDTTILSKNVDALDLKLGDYVTYIAPEDSPLKGKKITHAVVKEAFLNPEDGKMYILTKGIKKGATLDKPVPVENVLAKYIRTLTVISFIVTLLRNPWGYALIIALPLFVILILQFVKIAKMKTNTELDSANDEELKEKKIKELEEEIARKAVEEFIKNQEKNKH